jgi:cytochrome P450
VCLGVSGARRELQARALETLTSPDLPSDSLVARLRDEFGPASDAALDNVTNILFAGHDTTSSAICYLMWQLGRHPEVLRKVRGQHV